ncbi:hypothetical protein AVEN_106829-1 [Araneus ventricosus]|uniref:Uncharacterized protein n=1 Tax=Araneus ventricosus TaxID=182803 RepID=A0A4Y2NN10_ARAVE|nr:hypothetical protein AVEN_106829-1 [Araneus ventricosus]
MKTLQIYDIRVFILDSTVHTSFSMTSRNNHTKSEENRTTRLVVTAVTNKFTNRGTRLVELKLDLVSLVLIKKSYTSYWPLETLKFTRKSAEHNLTSHSETDRETKLSPLTLSKRWSPDST